MNAMTDVTPAVEPQRGSRYIIAIIVMLAANTIQSLVFCVPPPLLPSIAKAFDTQHHGVLIAHFVTPIAALGMMLGASASGFLISKTGLRNMVLASSFAIAILGSAPLWTATATILLGSRLLLGFGSGLLLTCSTLLVAQTFTGNGRPRMIGYQAAVNGSVFLLLILLSGTILRYAGWRMPFAIYAVFGATLLIMAFISVPRRSANPQSDGASDGRGLITQLWPIYVSVLFLGVLVTVAGVQLPFVLISRHILSPMLQSFIIGNSTIFSAIAGIVYGQIQTAIGHRRTLATSLLAAGIGFIVLGIAPGVFSACIGTALVGFGQGIFISYMIALTVQQAPPAVVGHAVGYAVAGIFLGSFMDPFVMGALKAIFGAAGAIFAIGCLTMFAAAGCFGVRRGLLVGFPNPVRAAN